MTYTSNTDDYIDLKLSDIIFDEKVCDMVESLESNGFCLHCGKRLKKLKDDNYSNIVAASQSDPILDDESKKSPINSLKDRIEVLKSITYINEIIPYRVEKDIKSISEQIRAESIQNV